MHEHDVRGERAIYDHETEDPRAARRRRRVADWGVGEELFDRMPSPRRRSGAAEPQRRDAHPRERRFEPAREEPQAGELDAPDARLDTPAADLDAPTRELVTAAAVPAAPAPRGGVEGRRTVVIGQSRSTLPARRERPSRTVGERLGHRPDRLASYAVALGLLLIIIAFLSS
jgi:hypothetical protein